MPAACTTAAGSFTWCRRPRAGHRLTLPGVQMAHSGSHHHREAAEHYEQAAKHHREAAKHHDAGNHEKAGYHAYVAHAHHTFAAQHAEEAEKHYATAHAPPF